MEDFSPAQAKRWIDQEFAKVNANNAAARIASELNAIKLSHQHGFADKLPNSIAAHEGLIERIRVAYP